MMWFPPLKGAYAIITTGKKEVSVMPTSDIRPHFFNPLCPCEPEITMDDMGNFHAVHNRFTEKDALQRSMQALFGEEMK